MSLSMSEEALQLDVEEALVLLALCLSSPYEYDATAEGAVFKLAACAKRKLKNQPHDEVTGDFHLAEAIAATSAEHFRLNT